MHISWDKVFSIFMERLPLLVRVAEVLYSWRKKSGVDKKAFVTDTLKTIATGIAKESTGGQAKTWDEIGDSVDMLIDGAVKLANDLGTFKEPSGIELYSPTETD